MVRDTNGGVNSAASNVDDKTVLQTVLANSNRESR